METLSLAEYLASETAHWFVTGKKRYVIQAMMVSKPTSFHNAYEDADYTAEDDGTSVVLKGTVGEMWISDLSKVTGTYKTAEGNLVTAEYFSVKNVFRDLVSIPSPASCFAMHVPADRIVTVITSGGFVLRTNLPGLDHGDGDYLVSSVKDGKPDVSDVWVVNGVLFSGCYYLPDHL